MNVLEMLIWIQRLAIVAFMIGSAFIVISADILKYVSMSVFSLYIFLAVSYVIHSKKNKVAVDKITGQVCAIVLGTILMIIVITVLFKILGMFSIV